MSKIHGFYTPEAIAFQDTGFLKELADIFAANREDNEGAAVSLAAGLEKAVKKRMGLNISVDVSPFGFSCDLPDFDRNSPLMKDYIPSDFMSSKRTIADLRKSGDKQLTGLVDLQACRVYGYFSDIDPIAVEVDHRALTDTTSQFALNETELAAMFLHEVGHLFTFFDFVVRSRTTNQIMAAAVRDLEGSTDYQKRAIIIQEAADALGAGKEVDAVELSSKKNESIYVVLISSYKRSIQSQNPLGGYDVTTAEALSDQFAQRFGAGVALTTALDKCLRANGDIGSRTTSHYVVMEALKIVLAGVSVGAAFIGAPLLLLKYAAVLPLFSCILVDTYDSRYDKPGARFSRIRDQIVSQLKDSKLPRHRQLVYQSEIATIDDIVERTKDHVQLLGLVYDYVIPGGISKRKSIEFQQGLERMTNNRLFLQASKLRTGQA